MTDDEREDILNEIAEREWEMFKQAREASGEPTQGAETYKLMRRMTNSAHDDAFLHSYLSDLRQAERDERNMVVEKYALLNESIPPLSQSPLLDEIVDAEMELLDEASELYPEIIKKNRSDDFHNFMRCELQTLSPKSLELYAEEIRKARSGGRNLALERHNWLASKLGKPLL